MEARINSQQLVIVRLSAVVFEVSKCLARISNCNIARSLYLIAQVCVTTSKFNQPCWSITVDNVDREISVSLHPLIMRQHIAYEKINLFQ